MEPASPPVDIALLRDSVEIQENVHQNRLEEAGRRVGATITRHLARSPVELPAVMEKIRVSRPGAMIVFPDSLTLVRRQEIAEFAARERIPSMFGWTSSRTRAASRATGRAWWRLQDPGEVRGQGSQGSRREPGADRAGEPDKADDQHGGGPSDRPDGASVDPGPGRPRHRIAEEKLMAERELTYGEAVKEAIAEEMRRDPSVFIIGRTSRRPGIRSRPWSGWCRSSAPSA